MIKAFLLVFLAIASYAQAAQTPELIIGRDQSFKEVGDLKITGLNEILTDFEYPDGTLPQVFMYDFNGDNVDDVLIKSYDTLCGTGGCEYVMIDGKTKVKLGDFFGNPIIVLKKRNAQSSNDIQILIYSGADDVGLDTYSYRNEKYTSISRIELSGKLLEQYYNSLEKVPVAKRTPKGSGTF